MSSSDEHLEPISAFVQRFSSPGADCPLSLAEKKTLKGHVLDVLRRGRDEADALPHHLQALTAVKILSRHKTDLDDLLDDDLLDLLLLHAGLDAPNHEAVRRGMDDDTKAVIGESQRCLNNLLLQSPVSRALCSRNALLSGLLELTTKWKDLKVPVDMMVVDMKILFLVTALCQETRKPCSLEHRGIHRLLQLLSDVVTNAKDRRHEQQNGDADTPVLTASEVDLVNETLKVLFNLTRDLDQRAMDEEEESQMKAMADLAQTLFTISVETEDKRTELSKHCINSLSNVPIKCSDPLLASLKRDIVPASVAEVEFDGVCMNVPKVMLDTLMLKVELPAQEQVEAITPVLSAMCTMSRHHRSVRKYLRLQILPPLRDLNERPEVGSKSRNKLCKLLTSPVDSVSCMVAEFLFILCKESVARMVKYTGYGNAAGLLARRGLMLGGKGDNSGNYSDEEEDSDTEEYAQNAHKVNPIVGCVEPARPSPFEGMTDEQKEYEAMKLVNLINDLHNVGLVKPAVPGPDGRPQAMEHVMQLQEAAEAMRVGTAEQGQAEEADSDDD